MCTCNFCYGIDVEPGNVRLATSCKSGFLCYKSLSAVFLVSLLYIVVSGDEFRENGGNSS